MNGIVVDTGAVYAVADKSDDWHNRIAHFLEKNKESMIVPVTVIPEVCYLLNTYLGQKAENQFILSCYEGELKVENLTRGDFHRGLELMESYIKVNIGFVDASVVAVAERLKINQIMTTDRRHFSLFRPKHCSHFTLLP